MCVLAFCEKRKMTQREFFNCASANDDGIGFGFNKNGKQAFIKGFMDANKAWEIYKRFPDKPHIVHFRLGTAGSVTPKLTHPFICTETSNLLLSYEGISPILFHNGCLASWEHYAKQYNIPVNENMSDTRCLAMLIAKLGTKEAFNLFYGGKFIILQNGTAYLRGDFIDESGVRFSNSGYKYSYMYGFSRKSKTTKTTTTNKVATLVTPQTATVPKRVKMY
ncbi:MAG: hypothetical protein BWY36_00907 [Candidatus Diapherotrites archaeon ADurb.Bin253]|nr:MAG: hypothetical protein BWY36_00907 [Candidatus Diapherotrites archaeon ADurb.Bin253]